MRTTTTAAAAGIVLATVLATSCWSHPTKYGDVTTKWVPGDPLPPFRSFHVHVLFQKEHFSDTCTGYDEALDFRSVFMKQFNVDHVECTGDFDQGRLCMFPTALTPFGPFPGPQWAAFIPAEHFTQVATWVMQNRGPFDVFIHPNTGYERNDHGEWGIWAGKPWPLDLTAAEFSHQLPDLYNKSCRDSTPKRKIPTQPPSRLNATAGHVRFFNFAQKTAELNVSAGLQVPALAYRANTWYMDVVPGAVKVNTASSSLGFTVASGEFVTVFVDPSGTLRVLIDDNGNYNGNGKMRIVNLIDSSIDVRRDGELLFSKLPSLQASEYDAVVETQYVYAFMDSVSGKQFGYEPIYVSGENSNTLWITEPSSKDDPTSGLVLIQDYPQDIPALVAPLDPVTKIIQ
jgi:aromatic ring-cleaving dioxygenase